LSYSFPKAARLRRRRDYQRLTACHRKVGELIVVDFRISRESPRRLGITVTKKFGKSHVRNRFKRIVREAFRLCQQDLLQGIQLNVKPRSAAQAATSADIYRELRRLFPLEALPEPKPLGNYV
jgi:ribonuclease P protein component